MTWNKFKFKSIYWWLTIFLVLVTSVLIFMLKRAKIEDNNFIIWSIKWEISIETRNDCLANIEDIINADKICWCYSKKIVQRLEPNEKIKSSSEKLNHRKSIKEIDNEFFKSTYKELLDECIESYRW